ncbi:hypothetical protein CRYUN_Cryun31cG0092200 [Craigia yunnanensis]
MEEVKFLRGLVAEMTAVQEELIEVLNDGLLWNTNANLKGQQIIAHQIRQFNSLVSQLNTMLLDYLYGLLIFWTKPVKTKAIYLVLNNLVLEIWFKDYEILSDRDGREIAN